MKRQLSAIWFGLALAAFSMSNASAEEKCKVSRVVPAANSTYTQQHVLDVGDVPGHQVRVFELHRTYPADTKPNCEGFKPTESWVRGVSDFIDRNGRVSGYEVIVLDNGDKIFVDWSGVSQTLVGPDGSKTTTYYGVSRYTGGTGRYQGIRGVQRESVVADIDKKTNEVRSEGEYWFEK